MKIKDILRCSITCSTLEITEALFAWITGLPDFEVVEVKNGFRSRYDPAK